MNNFCWYANLQKKEKMATFDYRDTHQYEIENATISVSPQAQNNISCWAGGTEVLRVAQDGFYVRGVRVPADDKEAETVYNAFKQFLVWAELNRR